MIRRVDRVSRERKSTLAPQVLQVVLVLVLAVPLVLAARKPKKEDGPAAQLSKAPRSAQSLPNPFAGNSEAVAAGHKLYQQRCAHCHGPDALGLERAVGLRSPAVQDAPPGSLFWALRNGRIRKGMPSWSQLPDQQLWQIVTYLKTLK